MRTWALDEEQHPVWVFPGWVSRLKNGSPPPIHKICFPSWAFRLPRKQNKGLLQIWIGVGVWARRESSFAPSYFFSPVWSLLWRCLQTLGLQLKWISSCFLKFPWVVGALLDSTSLQLFQNSLPSKFMFLTLHIGINLSQAIPGKTRQGGA